MPALARGQANTPSIINWFISVGGVSPPGASSDRRMAYQASSDLTTVGSSVGSPRLPTTSQLPSAPDSASVPFPALAPAPASASAPDSAPDSAHLLRRSAQAQLLAREGSTSAIPPTPPPTPPPITRGSQRRHQFPPPSSMTTLADGEDSS